MSLFLSEEERALILAQRGQAPLAGVYQALMRRVRWRAASPGLTGTPGLAGAGTTSEWWYHAAEYVSDAAMAYALEPHEDVGRWVRDVTLSLVRRSEADWAGPWFRNHTLPLIGHLETAHLCLAVVAALDLAPQAFTGAEREEAADVLRTGGMVLCRRWLERATRLNNWYCILASGLALCAAYLDDAPMVERAVEAYALGKQAFQEDGSYGESLQYSNYAAHGLMLCYEALVRRRPELADALSLAPYALAPRWWAAALLSMKPLDGWGPYPRPRVANFNDCSAIFRPSGDVLMHIAARARENHPQMAGLARWLFDTTYPHPEEGPHDLATFGMLNHFGFLTLPLLTQAPPPLDPAEVLAPLGVFDNGDSIVHAGGWQGETVLAAHGGGPPLHAPNHLHGDLNSFILSHRQERLLVDAGHSCYRNLMRELDVATRAHNTCSFSVHTPDPQRPQEDLLITRMLEQQYVSPRALCDGVPAPPVARGGRRLLAAQSGPVVALGSEVAALYGPPLETFARFWLLAGEHVLFVVDHIVAATPLRTTWNWLLNNRDGRLSYEYAGAAPVPRYLEAQRGAAAMRLYHLGAGAFSGPVYAYVHDAYHPLPQQKGEGRPGSGLLFRWQEAEAHAARVAVHAIMVDAPGALPGWSLWQDGRTIEVRSRSGLSSQGGRQPHGEIWRLELEMDDVVPGPQAFHLYAQHTGNRYTFLRDQQGG